MRAETVEPKQRSEHAGRNLWVKSGCGFWERRHSGSIWILWLFLKCHSENNISCLSVTFLDVTVGSIDVKFGRLSWFPEDESSSLWRYPGLSCGPNDSFYESWEICLSQNVVQTFMVPWQRIPLTLVNPWRSLEHHNKAENCSIKWNVTTNARGLARKSVSSIRVHSAVPLRMNRNNLEFPSSDIIRLWCLSTKHLHFSTDSSSLTFTFVHLNQKVEFYFVVAEL